MGGVEASAESGGEDMGDMEGDGAVEDFGPEEWMKELDKDEDGSLSLAELIDDEEADEVVTEQVTNVFNTADADKDGKLSIAELPTAVKEFEKMNPGDGKEDL